jgi:hypothetical protein
MIFMGALILFAVAVVVGLIVVFCQIHYTE